MNVKEKKKNIETNKTESKMLMSNLNLLHKLPVEFKQYINL